MLGAIIVFGGCLYMQKAGVCEDVGLERGKVSMITIEAY